MAKSKRVFGKCSVCGREGAREYKGKYLCNVHSGANWDRVIRSINWDNIVGWVDKDK